MNLRLPLEEKRQQQQNQGSVNNLEQILNPSCTKPER